jgi:D-alanyl-D-alanine carboxypeptidase/D-alanyl-D-alanine-endopeptidase (penicillin-binding protein 4)
MPTNRRVRFALRVSVRGLAASCLVVGTILAPVAAEGRRLTTVPASTAGKGVTLVRPLGLGTVSNSLSWRLPAFASDPRLKGLVGIDVVDLATGQTVAARHGYTPMMPASTFKILTAVVALRLMPSSTRFATEVVELPTSSKLPNVTRIAIVGGGDSLLASADLTRLMPAIAAKAQADGNDTVQINIDDSLFAPPSPAIGWLPKYTLGEISPVRSLERDQRRRWDTSDEVGRWFTTQMRAYGVKALYGGRTVAPVDATTITKFAGHTLDQNLRSMLLKSDNDIAEHVARLATIAAGEDPTWQGWQQIAFAQLRELHINTSGLRIYDGSGLSRSTRLTPAALVALIRMAMQPNKYPMLRSLLIDPPGDFPLAGSTGTLKYRFGAKSAKCARGKVRAKTGFLTGAGSLAGVANGVDGRVRVFSFLVNSTSPKATSTAVRNALDDMAATAVGCTFRR